MSARLYCRREGDAMAMSAEQERIRSYLQAQGAKLGPGAIVDKVSLAMDELHAAATSVPAGRFDDRPGPDEWSANEVMAHVVTAGARFAEGITRLLDGRLPAPPVADVIESGAPRRSAQEWWQRLVRDRSALFERVQSAGPSANLDGTIDHPFFGPLNWRESLLFLRLHDLDHAGQLRKIAEALG
jgi:DinB family protein